MSSGILPPDRAIVRRMWVYRTTGVLTSVLRVPLALATWLTTLVSGLIAGIPLVGAVYTLLISLIWQLFLWPLIGGAVLIGDTFLKLTGALSPDPEDRIGHYTKQAICQQWPYPLEADGKTLLQTLQDENQYGFSRALFELNDVLLRRQLGPA